MINILKTIQSAFKVLKETNNKEYQKIYNFNLDSNYLFCKKTFYNREANSTAFCAIQCMFLKPLFHP